jgi:uncharacterized protein
MLVGLVGAAGLLGACDAKAGSKATGGSDTTTGAAGGDPVAVDRGPDGRVIGEPPLAGLSASYMEKPVAKAFDDCRKNIGDRFETCGTLAWALRNGEGAAKDPERAFALTEWLCHAGDSTACMFASVAARLGEGTPTDPAKARELARRACDVAVPDECLQLVRNNNEDDGDGGVPVRAATSAAMLERLCEAGELRGCAQWGRVVRDGPPGSGVTANPTAAYALFEQACVAGDARKGVREACADQAAMLADAGAKPAAGWPARDDARAFALFLKACEAGEGAACFRAGQFTAEGRATSRDLPKAHNLLRRSCALKNANGCLAVSRQYAEGIGTKKDPFRAVESERLACDYDHGPSCTKMGDRHRAGQGVENTLAKALQYYEQGCTLGEKAACQRALELVEKGGARVDELKRVSLIEGACKSSDWGRCFELAGYYERGVPGVLSPDRAKARELYHRACDGGVKAACKARDGVK